MQLVIGQEDGTTASIEVDDDTAQTLNGRQIGDEFDGSVVGLDGYTLAVTGGSDSEGFPMKRQIQGTGRKKVLLSEGTGARNLEDGERTRKSVRGNTVSEEIVQLNCQVVESGSETIEALLEEDEA
ncbi:MAG: 30S ribosomal protein S6e [Candidatus Nanohaloarchaeota archaeon QJJ-5]|nr:30S ribosomal protein S6e [Candidatus Nanohaloarchaeota archaeon QJJ-5]